MSAWIALACLVALQSGDQELFGLDGFAKSIAATSDLNQDGVADLVVGDPDPRPDSDRPGSIWILSGADASKIRRINGAKGDAWFGASVAFLPRLSSDTPDRFVVSSLVQHPESSLLESENHKSRGRVFVCGVDGENRVEIDSSGLPRRFGCSVAAVGDLDADGTSDFLVCAPGDAKSSSLAGSVVLYSGRSLKRIVEVREAADGFYSPQFGSNALLISPRNQLARPLLVCSGGRRMVEESQSVSVFELDPTKTPVIARLAYVVDGKPRERAFGHALADVGDLDGDGWSDFAITAPEMTSLVDPKDKDAPSQRGRVVLISARTGSPIREVSMRDRTGMFGADVAVVTSSAWRKEPTLLVTSDIQVESSAGATFLFAYRVGSGELLERVELAGLGGQQIVVLPDARGNERLVLSRCECDGGGQSGSIVWFDTNSKSACKAVRRADLKP